LTTHHYFFESNEARISGLVCILDEMRSGDWNEIQVGAIDTELASMLGFLIRARSPDQLQAFRDKAEGRMRDSGVEFAGKPWTAQR